MRYKAMLATLCAGLFLAAPTDRGAAATVTNVTLHLPSVQVIRPPDLDTWADEAAHVRWLTEHRSSLQRIDGEQPILSDDPANLAVKRAHVARDRAARSAQTRALHGLGVDAMPNPQASP